MLQKRVPSLVPTLPSKQVAHGPRIRHKVNAVLSIQNSVTTIQSSCAPQLGATCCNLENMYMSERLMDADTSTSRWLVA